MTQNGSVQLVTTPPYQKVPSFFQIVIFKYKTMTEKRGESIEGIGRLKRWVVKADTLVSQRVLSQLRLHRLNSHLSALKSYLLLSNGDFSQVSFPPTFFFFLADL